MTFNEGMQIDTSTTSSGGGGGRGIAIGGGVGGLLILVVALLFGVDPSQIAPQDQSGQGTEAFDVNQCKTGADANKILGCRIIATGNSVDAVWSQPGMLPVRYTRPKTLFYSGQVNTACGGATSDVGPFYCPGDQIAYFDLGFFDQLLKQLGSSTGPLAEEYVVAHEFGHHVQNLLGDIGKAQQGAQGATGNGVRTELQADCYAGVWANNATRVNAQNGKPYLDPFTGQDLADVMSATQSVGDDWIQKKMTGHVDPYKFTHGTSEQRQHWFNVGYQSGDYKQCDTYDASDLG